MARKASAENVAREAVFVDDTKNSARRTSYPWKETPEVTECTSAEQGLA